MLPRVRQVAPVDADAFERALDDHRARFASNPHGYDATAALRDLHLARARALADDADAIAHFEAAAEHAIGLGRFASGSGEGLEASGRRLAILREEARLLERLGRRDDAIATWQRVAADPNGMGRDAEPELARLRAG